MENKIILITGAANGIGRSIADYFLKKGDTIIPTDVDEKSLKRFAGNEFIFPITMDVTDFESIQSALEQINEKFDHIDCIVNNAGVFVGGPIIEVDLNDFEKVISVNLMGYIRVVKAFYPLLRVGSRIINISSEVGRIAWPFNGPYTISKYAVEGFSDTLRRELMFKDINVIKIQPGSIDTNMMNCTKDSFKEYCENSEFEDQINRVWDVLSKEGCADPKFMARTVYKAAHIKYPRYTYRVKNHKGRRITEFLPARMLDFIMKKWI